MSCSRCRHKPNYPEESSYSCRFNQRPEGGCGKANSVHHIISRCPPIFTVVPEWEKHETEKEISETTKALDWEIDMSRLYEGLEPNTKYRLVSMAQNMELYADWLWTCGEIEQHICLAYEKDRWVGVRHDAFVEEAVGYWESVIRFCGERKVRPKILFYEAAH